MNTRDGLCNGDWIIIIVSEPRDRIMQYHLPRFLVLGTVYLIIGGSIGFYENGFESWSSYWNCIAICAHRFQFFHRVKTRFSLASFDYFFFIHTYVHTYSLTSTRAIVQLEMICADSFWIAKSGRGAKRILFSLRWTVPVSFLGVTRIFPFASGSALRSIAIEKRREGEGGENREGRKG